MYLETNSNITLEKDGVIVASITFEDIGNNTYNINT